MASHLRTLPSRLLALVALAVGVPATQADVFYSGRVNVDPSLGGNVVTGVKEFSGLSGWNYTNLDPATGTVTVLGYTQFSTSRAGLTQGTPASPAQRLVAVYALQGQFTGNLSTGNLSANFNGGLGQMRVYDFGTAPVLNNGNPGTWVPNLANLNQGVVGTFGLVLRPDSLLQGPPGGIFTEPMATFDPTKVNTARGTANEIGASATADVKFLYQGGSLLDYTPPGYNVNPLDPSLLVSLNERLDNGATWVANLPGNLANLETIFQGYLGTSFVKPGDVFNPVPAPGNGDTSMEVNGGTAIPGSQVVPPPPPMIPEPSTLLGFGLVCGAGGLYRMAKRKKFKI